MIQMRHFSRGVRALRPRLRRSRIRQAWGVPGHSPEVGDYLTVADTVPDPPPDHGYYFVTVVNDRGQRRYGRKSTNGVLSAGDPGVLPVCD
jgi:hypothetical protein